MMLKLQQLRAKRDALTKESRTKTETAPVEVEAPVSVAPGDLKLGRHGEGSRFISFSTIDATDYFPRIVPMLRAPISPGEFTACPQIDVGGAGVREKGRMYFAKVPPNYSGDLELFALPLAGKLVEMIDPVALAVDPTVLADSLAVDQGSSVVLIVERDLSEEDTDNGGGGGIQGFDPYKFYLWGIEDELKIGWLQSKPSNVQCLGRVVVALMEEKEERRQAKSCWEEESDVF